MNYLLLCSTVSLVVLGGCNECQQSHQGKSLSGEDIIMCDAFYDKAPLVHIDRQNLKINEYVGAIDINGGFTYLDANQKSKSVKLVSKKDASTYECKQQASDNSGAPSLGGGGLTPPSMGEYIDDPKDALNCGGFKLDGPRFKSLYKVSGTLSGDGAQLNVDTVKTYLTVSSKAFDQLLYRPFVGTANLRKENYNPDVEFLSYQQDKTAQVVLKPVAYDTKEGVHFTVANLDKAATGDNNTCYPALTSYGLQNPFYGTVEKNDVLLTKIYSMHFSGTHTMMLSPTMLGDNGLSNALGYSTMSFEIPTSMFSPAAWLNPQLDLISDLKQTHMIHGKPNGLSLAIQPARSMQAGKVCNTN